MGAGGAGRVPARDDRAARLRAARKTLAYLSADPSHARRFAAHAAATVTARATDTHDLKLLAAALEDHDRVSPSWRARYLAACTSRLRGASSPVTPVGRRIEEALIRSGRPADAI